MPRQIARHFAAPGGMANVDSILQVEMHRKSRKVIGIMVHIVAVGGLSRATVPTAIVGDNPIAMMQEEQHLVIPVVRAERPTMAENYRLAFTPVLVVNLYTVFGRDSGHESLLPSEVFLNKRQRLVLGAERSGPRIPSIFLLRHGRHLFTAVELEKNLEPLPMATPEHAGERLDLILLQFVTEARKRPALRPGYAIDLEGLRSGSCPASRWR
jgi:hypothetical protein